MHMQESREVYGIVQHSRKKWIYFFFFCQIYLLHFEMMMTKKKSIHIHIHQSVLPRVFIHWKYVSPYFIVYTRQFYIFIYVTHRVSFLHIKRIETAGFALPVYFIDLGNYYDYGEKAMPAKVEADTLKNYYVFMHKYAIQSSTVRAIQFLWFYSTGAVIDFCEESDSVFFLLLRKIEATPNILSAQHTTFMKRKTKLLLWISMYRMYTSDTMFPF